MYLHEMMWHEGQGAFSETCGRCEEAGPIYRCEDCIGMGMMLYCKDCILSTHSFTPLHRLQQWNGAFWNSVTLRDLGLRIQLGHKSGQICSNPLKAYTDTFIVIDTLGIHVVSLDFCNCEKLEALTQQLLCMSWFPATPTHPRTAATFRLLTQFHLISLESKISAYEFYNALSRLVNNMGLMPAKNRYEEFLRIARQWRHLKMVKCAGRAYDPLGLKATGEGECAVVCPACPQPRKNLPSNFLDVPPDQRYKYGLYVAIDANFRLKWKRVSKDSIDPSFSKGWAYFVEDSTYKDYLKIHLDAVQEKSTCSSHNAVNMADTKVNKGLSATGVGTVDCARHNMKLPNAVGNLQKGEKYINMDYLFFSTLRYNSARTLNVSYDIACQWSKNLWHRMAAFPAPMQLSRDNMEIKFFVPKFHLPAHIEKCQTTFSFNFLTSRGWANINPAASSTKEMGPGARRDILDDYFGHANWKKAMKADNMLNKLKDAIPKHGEHGSALLELEEGLAADHAGDLVAWKAQVEAWERDSSKPNPYEWTEETITLAAVHLKLAKEDGDNISAGTTVVLHKDCSPSILISTGLELEEQQRRLRIDRSGQGMHLTDNQEANLVQRSNTLQQRIDLWVKLQQLFMPALALVWARDAQNSNIITPPELFKLLLPSQIHNLIPCEESFKRIEWQLRYAQAHDALCTLRSNLCTRSYVLKYKDCNLRGQGTNTRARNMLKVIEARVNAAACKYQDAHKALVTMAPVLRETDWRKTLLPLEHQDLRVMSDLLDGESEGTRKLSWIWNARGVAGDEGGAMEDMCIEWCNARACVMRWSEEVELLVEEMRRVREFLEWEATLWEKRAEEFNSLDVVLAGGYHAYAKRQAALRRSLADKCHLWWDDTIAFMDHVDF
ncbi:hypothetical protein BDN67DRAFT_1048589 [Paxillus ammoniavirescens]|nr:hypothetical protein BDN67DRAFT_1048589 [Paxillus ammoniavirescens]